MRFSSRTFGAAVAVVVGAAASTLIATPSFAASQSCTVPRNDGSCTTSTVRANASGHYVKYKVCVTGLLGAAAYFIKDIDTGVIVKEGLNSLKGCDSDKVNGLHGRYRLTVAGNKDSTGTLSN